MEKNKRDFLLPREPLEIGETYKITDILDPDHALLRITGKKGRWSNTPLYCRYNYDPEHPQINEMFKDENNEWTCNPANYEDIDPDTEIEVAGFYR
jgi:hypothetical protein